MATKCRGQKTTEYPHVGCERDCANMCAGDDKSGMRDGLTLLGYNYNCRTNKCDCLRGNKWDDLESTVHKASSGNWACYTSDAKHSNSKNYDDYDDYVSIPSCSRIGQDTASTIAEEYASHPQSDCDYNSSGVRGSNKISTGKFGNTNECITIANDDCKGHMYDEIQNYCPKQSNNYSLLSQLKMKCQSEVTDSINA